MWITSVGRAMISATGFLTFCPMTAPLLQALELTTALDGASTADEVGSAFFAALEQFQPTGLYLGSFPAMHQWPPQRILDGCRHYTQISPPGWQEAYASRRLDHRNPVIFASARRSTAFRWSDPGYEDLKGWKGLELARECGTDDGLAVPCHTPGRRFGIVSIGFRCFDFSPREVRALSMAAAMTMNRIVELQPVSEEDATRRPLTLREYECLCCVADGLSDNEIAKQLGISPVTAHAHVENAKRKLGARSRAQAVALLLGVGS